jgi:hypothetical protein
MQINVAGEGAQGLKSGMCDRIQISGMDLEDIYILKTSYKGRVD